MTCEVHNKEINSQCAELLVRPLYHYLTSFSSNFSWLFLRTSYFPRYAIIAKSLSPKCFRHLNKINLPRKIFPPLKKELNLTIVKRAAQACQVGRVLDTPGLNRKLVTLTWSNITLFMSGDVIIPNKEGRCGGNQSLKLIRILFCTVYPMTDTLDLS